MTGANALAEAEPRYVALARLLKTRIETGSLPVGRRLPSEKDLSEEFAASRHTVREALRLLREEQLISSRKGSGSVVSIPPASESFRLDANSIDDLVAYAVDMYTEIRQVGIEDVDGREATRAGLRGGAPWLVVRGVARHRRRQRPVCCSDYYINRTFADLEPAIPARSGPIFLLIEERFGVRIAQMDQRIAGASLSHDMAVELGGEAGEAAIEVRRTYRTAEGLLAQVSVHTHRACFFQQTIQMRRL
ncbi:hypothetical protein B2G71_04485 [Novosphingobium sp. PC22D]|uniref:GntR family transcriptional regulator n=1 Tax=Novosphingobium sp. PC22D TaxID=1962403 RepID=UPI000BF185AA|nr:GntR family transcriptional regulator [Novosphingobium sp. PC22D]PEQ13594.1 hypothetical protein B2G71_04485 [Novosphingobium sp. PC22D]